VERCARYPSGITSRSGKVKSRPKELQEVRHEARNAAVAGLFVFHDVVLW